MVAYRDLMCPHGKPDGKADGKPVGHQNRGGDRVDGGGGGGGARRGGAVSPSREAVGGAASAAAGARNKQIPNWSEAALRSGAGPSGAVPSQQAVRDKADALKRLEQRKVNDGAKAGRVFEQARTIVPNHPRCEGRPERFISRAEDN